MRGLQQLLAFSETAKRGGFAAAARELGSSPSTLAKAVARLEASLGLRLFHRTTRQVRLTSDGERLFQRCQRVLAELEAMQSEASSTRVAPTGTLRIDMPIVFGRKVVLPVLARLLEAHPGLEVDARFSDAYVDLVKDSIDDQHILFRMPGRGHDRPQQFRVRGRTVTRTPERGVRVNDGDAMVQSAVLGLGLTQVPHYMVDAELDAGRLVELLPQHRPPTMPIHAVMPGKRMVPARVRRLLEALDGLAANPPPAVPTKVVNAGRPGTRNRGPR